MEDFDFDALRDGLINYFGTAVYYNPMAQADLVMVNTCSNEDLIKIALNNNYDLSRYMGGNENEETK